MMEIDHDYIRRMVEFMDKFSNDAVKMEEYQKIIMTAYLKQAPTALVSVIKGRAEELEKTAPIEDFYTGVDNFGMF